MVVRIVLCGPEVEVVAISKELSDKINFEDKIHRFRFNKQVVRAFGVSKD